MEPDKQEAAGTPEPSEHDSGASPQNGSETPGQELAEATVQSPVNDNSLIFPIVGIGASAGGLAACEQFFDNLPDATGMAFVVVQHLDPKHESELAAILQRHTSMTVTQVVGETVVQPDNVYIIPPDKALHIEEGKLRITDFRHARSRRTPIDLFLRSLGEDVGERAVCVIVSGTGVDGTLGLKRIKERGGVVMAQDPDDAQYAGMPIAAIGTGLVDVVAPAAELASKLVDFQRYAGREQLPATIDELSASAADTLEAILHEVRVRIGYDFTHYKPTTILRRIQRRMHVNGIEEMSSYLTLLRETQNEAMYLFKDFLISVTNFFRDAEAYQELQRSVIPQIISSKQKGETVRVWVPGCATGEEAYSLAMVLLEEAANQKKRVTLQIFATDLDRDALDFGRAALYPSSLVADLSSDRLSRYFTLEEHGYRVREELRQAVLFAEHNLLTDPPFSALDLISCRNVLIYLQRESQRHVFTLFHYGLRPEGYLFLGSSESGEGMGDLFEVLDKKQSLYRRLATTGRMPHLPISLEIGPHALQTGPGQTYDAEMPNLPALHLDLMLQRYAPPSLLVDSNYRIRYLYGNTRQFLQRPEGEATDNVLANVDANLRVELRTLLFQLFQQDGGSLSRELQLDRDNQYETLLLQVERVPSELVGEEMALVIFEAKRKELPRSSSDEPRNYDDAVVEQLEMELQRTQHRLQTFVEEYETSTEELKATNEELRSMTEELETSKEELQSTNEELYAVNAELKVKVDEITASNSDLQNLMASTEIATLFLDRDLRLKRYTPHATEIFNVIESDIGRPFDHISHKLDHRNLVSVARNVLNALESVEEEVCAVSVDSAADQGVTIQWYIMRMTPYRALDDTIEGVVATFVDVTELKLYEQRLSTREQQQSEVAKLGQYALAGAEDLQTLMDMAVRRLAETLDVPYCQVLALEPEGDALRLQAGIGWQEGLVGRATVDNGADSQAGYTLRTTDPVIVEDLATEERFNGQALLREHGAVSGMSVVIHGVERPYGVLGAHTTERRHFSEQDTLFMLAVANVLGTAVERHQTESALRHNEERLRMALHAASIGTWRVDLIEGTVQLDNEMSVLLGLPPSANVWQRENFSDYIHADDRPAVDAMWEQVMQGSSTFDIEHRIVREDGVVRWLRDRGEVTRNAEGDPHMVTGVVLDITEQRAAYEQQARLAAIVESSQTAIIRKTPHGVITDWNSAAERIFGWTRAEIVSQSIMVLVPDELQDEEEELLARVRGGEPVHSYETVRRTRQGDLIDMAVSLSPMMNAQGEVIAISAIEEDITEQRAAYEQQARLAAIVESSQTAIIRKTPHGVITDWNSAAERIFGWTRAEIVGQSIMVLVPDELQDEEEELLARVRGGEPVRSYETVRRTRQGDLIDMAVSLSPMMNAQGEVIAISAIEEDITDQRQAYEQQARLAAIVESSQNAILRSSADGIITDWNPAAERIFGWTAEEMVGRPTTIFIPEDAREERANLLARLQAGESIRSMETTRLTRSGKLIDVSMNLTPIFDEKGQVIGISGLYEDVTSRKQARIERQRLYAQVEAERVLLQAVLQQLPTGVIIAEAPSGRMVLGNEQVTKIFRFPYYEAADIEDYQAYVGYYADGRRYRPQDWPLARAVMQGETVHNEEIIIDRGDGTQGTIAASAAPIYDAEGQITTAVVIFSDISAMKETEANLRSLTDTLEERVSRRTEQVRRLAADLTRAEEEERRRVAQVLHDHLQQLLFGAQVKLSVLGEVFEEGDVAESALLLGEVRRVLDDSIHVTRRLVVDLSPPVLEGEGLKEAVTWLAAHMRELHGLQINVAAGEPTTFPQQETRVLLFHLVRELLFNVVKHAGVEQAEVKIEMDEEKVRLTVEDHGKGFDTDKVMQSRTAGTGLSRMRERVRLLGGALTILSWPNDGTRVTVEVPLDGNKPAANNHQSALDEIIVDDPDIIELGPGQQGERG